MTQWLGSVLLHGTTVIALVCVVYYHLSTGWAWRDSEVGRHLMATTASMAAVLLLSSVRVMIGAAARDEWFTALRLVVFATVPAVLLWRLSIMVRARRDVRRGDDTVDSRR